MKRGRKKTLKEAMPKYRLIQLDSDKGKEIAKLIKTMTNEHHEELRQAMILPAWMIRNKQNKDGQLVLGKMKKASELEREAHGADAFLLLNFETWPLFDERQKKALIDHELEHLTVVLDENTNEAKLDGHSKIRYRVRKHDVEEFQAIINRHGCWKSELKKFAENALNAEKQYELPMGKPLPPGKWNPEAAASKVH